MSKPPGPFLANYGPLSGYILFGQAPVMSVLDAAGNGPIGIART